MSGMQTSTVDGGIWHAVLEEEEEGSLDLAV